MQGVDRRWCGRDGHKEAVVACLLADRGEELRAVSTMPADLRELIARLRERGCQRVARGSTGS